MHPGRFLEDVLDQPRALREMAAAHGDLGELAPAGSRVLFLGMGSSRFAALTVAALLRSRGVDAHAEMASTGAPQPPSADTLVVAISATGGSPETLQAMRRHLGTSKVVGITSRPERPVGAEADLCLPLHCDEEVSGIACKSHQCTLGLLHLIAGHLLGDPELDARTLLAAADASERLLDSPERWLPQAVDLLAGRAVHVLAPAERIGSAEQSALMLREVPRVRADACETGDWSHVDVYLSKRPGLGLLLLRGSAWEAEVLEWAASRSTPVITVGGEIEGASLDVPLPEGGDQVVRTLVETHAAELIAAELWRRDPI